MITKEDVKKVEKLQKIEKQIKDFQSDYSNLDCCRFQYYRISNLETGELNYCKYYIGFLKVIIKNKIRILKKKRNNLIKNL